MSGYGQNLGQNLQAQPAAPAGGAAAELPKNLLLAGIAGGALVFIGSFLPWATVEGDTSGGLRGDGVITLFLGILAAVFFVVALAAKKGWATIGAAVPAAIALVVAVLNLADVERQLKSDAESQGVSSDLIDFSAIDASTGVGVYVVLLGSLVATAAGVFLFLKSRKG